MPTLLLLEDYRLTVRIPADCPRNEVAAMRRVLASGAFRARLQAAARRLARKHPELALARLKLSR